MVSPFDPALSLSLSPTFNPPPTCGTQVLLGIWGPVIVSVGNLLTIVLVEISNVVFGDGMKTITLWSVLGSVMIVGAFAVLAVDVMRVRA